MQKYLKIYLIKGGHILIKVCSNTYSLLQQNNFREKEDLMKRVERKYRSMIEA